MGKVTGVFLPLGTHKFMWREAAQGLEPFGVVVGQQKGLQVLVELLRGLIVEALNGGLFKRAIHPFDLAIGPGVLGLGEAMIDVGLGASQLEAMGPDRLAALEGQLDLRDR